MNINGKWYTEPQIEAYVTELENKVAELEAKHWNECRQIARYDDELRKAKELLKAAVKDFAYVGSTGTCIGANCYKCPLDVKAKEKQYSCVKWKHADEALALIGEDTNVPAREDGEQND